HSTSRCVVTLSCSYIHKFSSLYLAVFSFVFFFIATSSTEIYTLSLHDALPIWLIFFMVLIKLLPILGTISGKTVKLMVLATALRSEERFSRNAETDLVCRLLLEKKKQIKRT